MARYIPKRARFRRAPRLLMLAALLAIVFLVLRDAFSTAAHRYIAIPLRPELFPVADPIRLPRRRGSKIPAIQHKFAPESDILKAQRQGRLAEVRNTFLHAWNGYKKEAWAQDELKPIGGGYKKTFCGWAATLVDTLDTLIIMELYDEFDLALVELQRIDFNGTTGCHINLFETTIRHLGGLLSAYDLTKGTHSILIEKAVELGEVLFTAFDTPNRMPSPHYEWSATNPEANSHLPSQKVVLAVLGSLSLEFTRLSQITGDDKYYDGIQRIMNELEKWQSETKLPGMWPAMVDSTKINETIALGPQGSSELYTLGALADSAYEYLPKQYLLLGGQLKQYRSMYEDFIDAAKKYLFFRPMNVGDKDILLTGSLRMRSDSQPEVISNMEHLACFTGGMLAIAGKIFRRPADLADGRRLTDGCVWAYRNTATGIMPETFTAVPCVSKLDCPWDQKAWYEAISPSADEETVRQQITRDRLAPGFARAHDRRYLLRPEAIESVFILWRVTGDRHWVDSGWEMFKSIQAYTTTDIAHSAIDDVLSPTPKKVDEMESFWLAETLKYFYLLYSEPDVVSLDHFVLNTEAHPLRRPR